MWYKIAAYGTIDLNKYISESIGEDFDVEAEISNLIISSINDKKLDYLLDLINKLEVLQINLDSIENKIITFNENKYQLLLCLQIH